MHLRTPENAAIIAHAVGGTGISAVPSSNRPASTANAGSRPSTPQASGQSALSGSGSRSTLSVAPTSTPPPSSTSTYPAASAPSVFHTTSSSSSTSVCPVPMTAATETQLSSLGNAIGGAVAGGGAGASRAGISTARSSAVSITTKSPLAPTVGVQGYRSSGSVSTGAASGPSIASGSQSGMLVSSHQSGAASAAHLPATVSSALVAHSQGSQGVGTVVRNYSTGVGYTSGVSGLGRPINAHPVARTFSIANAPSITAGIYRPSSAPAAAALTNAALGASQATLASGFSPTSSLSELDEGEDGAADSKKAISKSDSATGGALQSDGPPALLASATSGAVAGTEAEGASSDVKPQDPLSKELSSPVNNSHREAGKAAADSGACAPSSATS